MDAQRNVERLYLRESDSTIADFTGESDWRETWHEAEARGTPFDIFGGTAERRLERRLLAEYEEHVAALLPALCGENHELACRIAELPARVLGFDQVKMRAAEAMERERDGLLRAYQRAAPALET